MNEENDQRVVGGDKAAKKKRIRDPHRTRQHIIDAALDEFTERGFDGARMDAIAEQSQTNKSLIYRYFESKEALYIAGLTDTYEKLRASQHEIRFDDPDPVESMRKLIESTFDSFAKNPRLVRILTHENVQNARFLKQSVSIKLLYTPLMDKLSHVISKGQEAGIFRAEVDMKNLYISISALGYFYFSNMHTLGIVLDEDLSKKKNILKQRKQAVEMVLAYLKVQLD
ncbi:TetR family transcriptional regulator [Erwinia sp. S63]|uniref:TetR/AcrR family transcriptional regulator n=1 Tax=Erwinia sp. S63 TaxID=2769341 RepID=UPI00190C45BB|nr:TetR/AcrR family transcriptional regulator [Erwinia sp. S63]MBK0097538.1 TetR family transcriptional regulator [Erwinia sp. S63]